MYNSIYPVNINYTKHNQFRKADGENYPAKNSFDNKTNSQRQDTFPNGNKVAIDYTRGNINISQVLTDFRSTILAINAPDDVKDEVYTYLNLVEKESKKDNPIKDIIVANLKNASKISDAYIASALKKPSNVVEKWIETLFLQNINLKSNPNEINPDFQLQLPEKKNQEIEIKKIDENAVKQESEIENTVNPNVKVSSNKDDIDKTLSVEVESNFELSDDLEKNNSQTSISPIEKKHVKPHKKSLFAPNTTADIQAKNLFIQAKSMPRTNKGDTSAINLLNEALGIIAKDDMANKNIKAAIHIERGKIFDNYDYVDYALRDYYEATKSTDYNLKAQAHYKSGQIYDEFSEFYPAMDNYLSSVSYSTEADNSDAQTRVLNKIAGLYARQYDIQKTLEFSNLAIQSAKESKNNKLIAKTYSDDAQNSQYLGQNDRALNSYKNALKIFSRSDESYDEMAHNYEQAAVVMRNLGNYAKASKLQSKANLYRQKAKLQQQQLEEVN